MFKNISTNFANTFSFLTFAVLNAQVSIKICQYKNIVSELLEHVVVNNNLQKITNVQALQFSPLRVKYSLV